VIIALYSITATLFLLGLKGKEKIKGFKEHHILLLHTFLNACILVFITYSMTHLYRSNIMYCLAFAMLLTYVSCIDKSIPKSITCYFFLSTATIVLLASILPDQDLLSDANHGKARSIFGHIFLAFTGYSSFLILSIASFLYLWQNKILKSRQNLNILKYFPNLVQLDQLQKRCLYLGIIVFTIAIGMGKINQKDFGLEHQWGSKEILAVMIWSLYLFLSILRFFSKIQKHSIALFNLIGTILILGSFFFLKFSNTPSTQGGL